MEQNPVISKHIFMFPFTWKSKEHKDNIKKAFESIKVKENSQWERCVLSPSDDQDADIYNERNYFYPFTHETIYDQGNRASVRHFERKDVEAGLATYVIETNDKKYELPVEWINLNFYSSGVGILSIFTRNTAYGIEADILNINQFGRRLYPPYYSDVSYHSIVAKRLSIEGLAGEYCAEFIEGMAMHNNTQAGFIDKLICEASDNICDIKPILDDRMFTMSWYRYGGVDLSDKDAYKGLLEDRSQDFLFKYIFIDTTDACCQSDAMYTNLLKDAVYDRWQGFGTLYGVTRYSLVMLTSEGCPDFLLKYFETEYVKMVEIVLVQRASILRLSNTLKASCCDNYNNFRLYYSEYIEFLSKFRFPDISAQEQATELYDSLCEKMRIKDNAEHLDNQFNEIQEYLELNNQRSLNTLAAIAVPVAIVSGFFTFFFHDSYQWGNLPIYRQPEVYWSLTTLFVTIVVLLIIVRRNR